MPITKRKTKPMLSQRQRELNKQREHALSASERASNDTYLYRKIADLRSAIFSRRVLSVKFKRILFALGNAKRFGNKKRIQMLEDEAAHTESDFKIQDDKVREQEAELQYLTRKNKKSIKNGRQIKFELQKKINKLEEQLQKLTEEIYEIGEDGFPIPRTLILKQIEMTELNIELAKQRIRLIKFTSNDLRDILEHQEVINQDQAQLQRLKHDLKQYE